MNSRATILFTMQCTTCSELILSDRMQADVQHKSHKQRHDGYCTAQGETSPTYHHETVLVGCAHRMTPKMCSCYQEIQRSRKKQCYSAVKCIDEANQTVFSSLQFMIPYNIKYTYHVQFKKFKPVTITMSNLYSQIVSFW